MILEKIYKDKMADFSTTLNDFPWESQDAYGDWLAQTWYFVKESTRLLNLCGALLPQENEDLHNRFIDHAKEEQGHAAILLRDLKSLGKSVDEFSETSATSAFYQTQYYWVQFQNPLAFFGYIILLEGLAVEFGESIYKRIEISHGKVCGSFLKVHSAEDIDHIEKAIEEISRFSPEQIQLVKNNFTQSCSYYEMMLLEIQSRCSHKEPTLRVA